MAVRSLFSQKNDEEGAEMKVTWRSWCLLTVLITQSTLAQVKPPVETRNAALRYWMAFAEMHDPPADRFTQELLEKVSIGQASWDEAKLGRILDSNAEAIRTMQRATTLPECDWGLEYSRGPRAPVAYLARARVMARLATLQATREMAAGDSDLAVDHWLSGIRFAVHLAKGGTLISTLTGKNVLLPNLRMLTVEAKKGRLTEAQVKQIVALVGALPQDVFDWASAWENEEIGIEAFLKELKTSKTPRAVYEASMGEAMPEEAVALSSEHLNVFRDYMAAAKTALKFPPDAAQKRLTAVETQRQALSELAQRITPSPKKVNESRSEVVAARKVLLEALGAK